MEHRYGVRYLSAIDVFVRSQSGQLAAQGRLLDVSLSGAFVATSIPIAPLTSITIEVLSVIAPARRCKPIQCQPIEAQVIRRTDSGLGIEWQELQPASLSQLLDCRQPAPAVLESQVRLRR